MGQATINGRTERLPDDAEALLVDVLREDLRLTGTKLVCGGGVCGACTVLLDGIPVASCLLPVGAAAGKAVITIEGIGATRLHPVQKAFMALDALQCGFCTPGFIVEAVAFHDTWRKRQGATAPPRQEIVAALSGHLCRCGAYTNIIRAVAEACAGRFDGDDITAPRQEARAKVTGAAHYTVDVRQEGQLEGVLLRSHLPHALIRELDLAPALALSGVKAAVSLLGKDKTVRFVGDPIAAVAAIDGRTARAARDAIKLVSEALPSVVGLDAARRADAPIVFSRGKKALANVSEGPSGPAFWKGNVRGPSSAFSHNAKKARRWLDAARGARDPLLVEGTFRTGAQSHTALEPHAAVARFSDGKLTVHVSTQAVAHLRHAIARRFRLAEHRVRVIAEHVGGGFGSKGALGAETIAAIELSRAANAPVRVAFDRHEELSFTGCRPAAEIRLGLLATRDGKLRALSLDAYSDTGAGVNSTIAGLARLIYPAEAKHLADFDVVSNAPPGTPFRGPGGPPMAFALEQAIDETALRLRVDPIALRKRWDTDPNRQRLYDWASGLDLWRQAATSPPQRGRFRRGVGIAAGYWLYLWEPGSTVEIAVDHGRVVASVAVQDIGTGSRSVLANTVARELGLHPDEIEVRIGDSRLPVGPGSGGSRTTASIVPPALAAVAKLKAEIERHAKRAPAPGSNAPWRELIARSPDLRVRAVRGKDAAPTGAGIISPLQNAGVMGRIFGWMLRRSSNIAVGAGVPSSVQVVEVEVDTWLGRVRVLNVQTGIAVGRLAAPELARNQAMGSVVQGIGYALYESRELDARGDILTANLEDYRIPGIGDTPEIGVHFDEAGFEHVAGGSVGIGEVSTVPTSAAIANAVRHATGFRPLELPLRPDRLFRLLQSGGAA
jgi:CO/xanthine dehydrogenase Mo-binding subunit/aerobic-type carbon monoxide dehydrogenase small subunit (CoxS/CutS family)